MQRIGHNGILWRYLSLINLLREFHLKVHRYHVESDSLQFLYELLETFSFYTGGYTYGKNRGGISATFCNNYVIGQDRTFLPGWI